MYQMCEIINQIRPVSHRCWGLLWWWSACVCVNVNATKYQYIIILLNKTLLMPSPQCILTISSYKTNSNSVCNSRYSRARPYQASGFVILYSSVFSMQWLVRSENSGLNQQLIFHWKMKLKKREDLGALLWSLWLCLQWKYSTAGTQCGPWMLNIEEVDVFRIQIVGHWDLDPAGPSRGDVYFLSTAGPWCFNSCLTLSGCCYQLEPGMGYSF